MTEAEWLAYPGPRELLDHLWRRSKSRLSVRKLRLFACACDRQVWEHLSEERRRLVESIERRADGEPDPAGPERHPAPGTDVATAQDVYEARMAETFGPEVLSQLRPAADPPTRSERAEAFQAAKRGAGEALLVVRATTRGGARALVRRARALQRDQAVLVEDLFGNPFRPVTFDPHWRTSDVVGLARSIYADGVFERLPMLADALMDAGCADDEVLGHCRDDGPHARGCWVVDAILGRH